MRTHLIGRGNSRSGKRASGARRPGKILVMTAFLIIPLVGMLGLVIDLGRLLGAHRQAQNAADSAALAAATALRLGYSNGTATTAANNMVTANGLPASPLPQVNIPPQSGNYVGNSQFAEVIVTYPISTVFIQLLGVSQNQTVSARAVAGWSTYSANLGIILLGQTAAPGLYVSGDGAVVKITDQSGAKAGIAVYSMYGGNTAVPGVTVNFPGYGYGGSGNNSYSGKITQDGGYANVQADFVNISGGVMVAAPASQTLPSGPAILGYFPNLTTGTGDPPVDPLAGLPTPVISNGVTPIYWGQTSSNTVVPSAYWNGSTWMYNTNYTGSYSAATKYNSSSPTYVSSATAPTPQNIALAGSANVTLPPGIYGAISLSGNPTLAYTTTFAWNQSIAPTGFTQPTTNIYVLAGGTASDLSISGNQVITGSNMMFYNTGTKYSPFTGDNGSTQFGSISFSGDKDITYTPPTSGTFQNVLMYQSRSNTNTLSFVGGESNNTVDGIIYAPTAPIHMDGNGTLNTQIIASSMQLFGNGTINVNMKYATPGTLRSVYLVE